MELTQITVLVFALVCAAANESPGTACCWPAAGRIYNRASSPTEIAALAQPSVQYDYGLDRISRNRNGTVPYLRYDGLGSVRYLTDASGNLTDPYTYDAFGNLLYSTGSTPNNYRFAGEQWDADLRLYYLRSRYYCPDLGRFWTMDTFEGNQDDPLSLHRYLYTEDNPVNLTDPSGRTSLGEMMVTMRTIAYMAANMAIRAAPALSRVTVVLYEAATGETVAITGGAAITGYAALSRAEGGIGSWEVAAQELRGLAFGPYGYVKQLLHGTAQAGHLNQSGAYTAIAKKIGACVDLGGNALVSGTEHNQFHAVMERFFDQYREGGAKEFEKISNRGYLQALRQALINVKDAGTGLKFTQRKIEVMVDFAEKEQRGYGYFDGPGGKRPELPGTMNLTGEP